MSKNKLIRQGTLYQFLVAIVFGLIGFGLNFLDIELLKQPEFKISILVGLLFPMIIAHAWGWRYGLLSALAGGCQSMWWLWHTDGYGLLYAVPIFTIWVIWHGYWADYRQNTDQPRWFHSAFIIEIPFRVVSELGFYTIFRWLVSLNPPPWAPSITWDYVSLNWINTVAVKHIITSYILLLIIHVLLRFMLVRRFFRLKKYRSEQIISGIYAGTLLVGMLTWVLDGLVTYFLFNTSGKTLLETTILNISPQDMFRRYVYLLASVVTGISVARLFSERGQSKKEVELLLNLSRQASTETSLDDLLFFITDQIVEVIPLAEAASIFLYDEKRKVARVQAWAGLYGIDVKGIEFNVAGSQIGRIIRAKKPVLIKNVAEDPDFVLVDKPGTREIKSQIAVPLIYKKQVIGIIYADNLTRTDVFSQKDLDLLESIGNQLAGVIENARLLDQVRKSEQQYHSVVEDSPGHICRFKPGFIITFVNETYCQYFGKKSEELVGMNFLELIPKEDRESIMSNIISLSQESPILSNEHKVIKDDGEIRWMRWANRALFDEKGEVISYQSFGEDITESKRLEKNLKISEERFRTFMENIPAMAYIKDSDLHHIYGNPASIAADGFQTLEEYINTKAKDCLPKETTRKVEDNDKRVLTEKYHTSQEYTRILNDGKEQTVLDIKFPIQLPDGDIQVGGLAIDITDMRKAQKALSHEQEKAQKYLDIAKVMIVAINEEGEITLINQKGASILGYQIEELIGKNWFNTCVPTADRKQAKKIFDEFITGGMALGDHFEQTVITKSGEKRIIDWHSTPLWEWDDAEKHRIGSLNSGEDITQRVQNERELLQSERRYKEAESLAHIGHWDYEPIEGKLNWSEETYAIFEIDKDAGPLSIEDFLNRIHSEDRETIREQIKKSESHRSDYRIVMDDGSLKHMHEEVLIDHHEDGEVKIMRGTVQDITERVQAEQVLKQEQEKAQRYLDIAGVALVALNQKGEITLINQKGCQILGYQEDELIGVSWFDACLPERNRKEVKGVFKKLMTGKLELVEFYENQILTRSGEERIIAWHNTALKDEKGNNIGTLASGEDITARVRAEQLLSALNRAVVVMGTSQTHQDIFNAIAKELKQIDISCMLFPLDETQGKLFTKYMSYESALLTTTEKLLGVEHGGFSFPIEVADEYREVIREKKTVFIENPEQMLGQVFSKLSKKLLTQIIKTLRVQRHIFAPLIVDNQVIGLFSIQSNTLTQEDVPAATAFADQLSSAWNKVGLLQNLRKTVEGTIHTIAATVEARDPYTAGHQGRVSDLATAIAIEMKLTDEQVEGIKMAGIIHDLGKINIPAEILIKPGKLSELEFSLIKTHPQNGFDLLKEIEFPWPIAEMVLQHHEKMDGSGYPQGLKGDDILLEARILAVADIVEAMSSHRPYRPALGIEKALAQIKQDKGKLLDPKVVNVCLKIFKEGYKLLEA